jgi:uncharacterized protein
MAADGAQGMNDAGALIARLGLQPHPEGGWYRETWRVPAEADARSPATAILFLLEEGQRSHWHRVDADELWLWHAGAALDLRIAEDDTSRPSTTVLDGEHPQGLIPAGQWQAAEARSGWVLVSCVVVPGFDFAGFTLAPPEWSPGPQAG